MWNLKYGTAYLQNRNRLKENRLVVAKGEGEGEGCTESLGLHMQAIKFRMNKQRSPTVQHRALYGIIL